MHTQKLSYQFSKEFKLLLALTSPDKTKDNHETITKQLPTTDLDKLFLLAKSHRVHLLLCKTINGQYKDLIPPSYSQKFDKEILLTSITNLSLVNEMLVIISLLKKSGIIALPFKGPTLAQQAYGATNLRFFGDIDILVDPKDIAHIQDIFITQGYSMHPELSAEHLQKYIQREPFLHFYKGSQNIAIDLQCDLTDKYLQSPYTIKEIQEKAAVQKIAETEIQVLPHETTLLNLCIHSTKHSWQILEFMTSIAHFIARNPIDLEELLATARQLKAARIVLLSLNLCRMLYTINLPETLISEIQQDAGIRQLSWQICKKFDIDQNQPHNGERFATLHISIRDSFADKLQYIFRLLFRPTIKEWEHYPKLAAYPTLYFLIRPLRLAKDFFSQRVRKLENIQ